MFLISCFADEIATDLKDQISFLLDNKISFVDLRGVYGKNVLDLSQDELENIKESFSMNKIGVSAIATPIGKIKITEDFSLTLDKLNKAIYIAKMFGTRYIRVFSFYMKPDEMNYYQDEVVKRFIEMVKTAKDNDVVLIHENDADLYGESSLRSIYLLEAVDSANLKAVFDPSNFVIAGEEPLEESFPRLVKYIEYMHIKDSIRGSGKIVMAGQGDGRIKEILEALKERNEFFISMEPHLSYAGGARGFTGPELFKYDFIELKSIMDGSRLNYR